MSAALVIVPPSPGAIRRCSGIECLVCSAHFGFAHRPKVTIRPQSALRLPSGTIVIENPVVLCASCLERGIETPL